MFRKQWIKHPSSVLLNRCEGNPLVTGRCLSQRFSNVNVKSVPSDDVIISRQFPASQISRDLTITSDWPGQEPGTFSSHNTVHDDFIKWKHFPRNWPFVRGIHRSPVNSPHQGQWRTALMFSLICVWINGWENNREAGDLRCYRAHYDVIVMGCILLFDVWAYILGHAMMQCGQKNTNCCMCKFLLHTIICFCWIDT